jgi:copper chaperone CopZ
MKTNESGNSHQSPRTSGRGYRTSGRGYRTSGRGFLTLAALILLQLVFAAPAQLIGQEKKQKAVKTETMKCWASLHCETCQAKVEKNIPFEKGVTDIKVDLPTKIVTVTFRPDKTSPAKLEKAIQKLGFTTEIVKEETQK